MTESRTKLSRSDATIRYPDEGESSRSQNTGLHLQVNSATVGGGRDDSDDQNSLLVGG